MWQLDSLKATLCRAAQKSVPKDYIVFPTIRLWLGDTAWVIVIYTVGKMAPIVGALPPPPGVTPNFDHPKDVLRTVNFVIQPLSLGLVTITVFMRVYTRAMIQRVMYKEDWACVASWFSYTAYVTTNIMLTIFGGGRHQWEVSEQDVINFRKVAYAGLMVYGPTACLIKLTLLLVTTRLCAAAHKSTFAIKTLMLLILAFYIPIAFPKIFICSPIAAFWNPAAHPNASCISVKTLYFADTGVSVVSDFSVLIAPIPLIWGMNLSRKTKIKVIALLAAGGIACVTTLARLVLLIVTVDSKDTTLNTIFLNLLAMGEVSLGLSCACLPSLGIFWKHFFGKRERKAKDSGVRELETVGSGGKPVPKKDKFDNSLLRWTHQEVEADK
ncbi:hypothetical protein VTL71DRAFT_4444 [Oculimacula yallundae]|uniref:Rhodopsin domain-containing protein n=1 Tax=Oculimacula yallundae TaxID=86028 RepID=A0ABR4C218_9HELO